MKPPEKRVCVCVCVLNARSGGLAVGIIKLIMVFGADLFARSVPSADGRTVFIGQSFIA